MKTSWLRSDWTATLVAVVALAAAGARRASLPNPTDAAAYHERVRQVADATSLRSDGWTGVDTTLPQEALDQLRPNVAISRRYMNRTTGRIVDLLLIQCTDVRDLAPHYPPVCYPGQGLSLVSHATVALNVDGGPVTATRYAFEWNDFRRAEPVTVDNFMVLPDGGTRPDMTGMEQRIGAAQRYFGAAQVQVVYSTAVDPAEQTRTTQEILRPYWPLLRAIRTGAQDNGRH